MDELDKTVISKMMPLLSEYQRRAFLGLYYEKLGCGSAANVSSPTGMSPTTLIAAKREVAELGNDPRARPQAGKSSRICIEGWEYKSVLGSNRRLGMSC